MESWKKNDRRCHPNNHSCATIQSIATVAFRIVHPGSTMRFTKMLEKAATAVTTSKKRNFKSLALSVYFKQPDLGMKDYEILSRASAFLLGIDPPERKPEGPYGHLEILEERRKTREFQHRKKFTPAGGEGREIMDLSWLEFVPREVRPQVHIVASSHVLSPFLWKDYYPQDWLTQVRQEHCTYALEVFDSENPNESLAKIGLDSTPFHHPEGRDISVIHFKEEESSLKTLKNLGVKIQYLRSPEKMYEKGETMYFDGYVVSEPNTADDQQYGSKPVNHGNTNDKIEDLRVFYPHKEIGKLSFHTNDRFFATTPEPLPEGLCGAPVLDSDGELCGTVEGIVPVDHKDERLAGSAAFIPSYVLASFVDYVERGLLQLIMPEDLFQMAVTAKKTNSIGGGLFKADKDGNYTKETNWEEAHDRALKALKKRYTQKEVDAILDTVAEESKEVLEIMDREGGDMDEIVQRVRAKTMQIRAMVRDQYEKKQSAESTREEKV
jgi:hypothetical protein